jgi:hypothetical protein
MLSLPIRADDRPAEGIHPHQMNAAEAAAVAQVIADYLRPQDGADGLYDAPVVPGEVRHSARGVRWVRFTLLGAWFRLMDVPSRGTFPGARIVFDIRGCPLGNVDGPLVLTVVQGRPAAFCQNTGYNFDAEIRW